MCNRASAVFTGSRAEYGLLTPVMRAIQNAPALSLQVIAGDTDIDPAADGFPVAATVPVKRRDHARASTARAIGTGTLAVADALEALAPDAVVIYGDRFEAFAAMIASTQMSLPTFHIEGGDITQGGTLDDVVRHAMTKLAHIHLTTNADAAARVAMLGEEPWRIHNTGFPTIDLIEAGDFTPPQEALAALDLDPDAPIILFTQHPITTAPEAAEAQITASLTAIARAQAELGAQAILTYPNGDLGSEQIITALRSFTEGRENTVLRQSLGRRLYHGALNLCGRVGTGVCVGNSSSGVKETAAFACPAVDIGPRQTGRLRGDNVAHVPHEADAIFAAISRALSDQAYRAQIAAMPNPYGTGNTGPAIARLLSQTDLTDPAVLAKQTLLPPE